MSDTQNKREFDVIQDKIEQALSKNEPIDNLVKEQISILEKAHDEFVKKALDKGYKLSDVSVAEVEIQQFEVMKALAQSIGLAYDKYDELIKASRIRVLGEENYKIFFEAEGNKK